LWRDGSARPSRFFKGEIRCRTFSSRAVVALVLGLCRDGGWLRQIGKISEDGVKKANPSYNAQDYKTAAAQ
jgi:hypothetical protein